MGKRYGNPPITEAVCEFRFEPRSAWDLAIPGLVFEQLKGQFPKRRSGKALEVTIKAGPAGIQQQLVQTDHLQFLREDETMLVEVGPHRLGVSHFKPYSNWESFLPIICQVLGAYRAVADPKGFARIGLRYKNRIDIAGDRVELEQYVDFYPFIGERLPQDFVTFLLGIEAPFEQGRDVLRLQITTAADRKPEAIPILIDLDYFLGRSGGVALGDEVDWLNQAHDRIEAAFEGCIKEALRRQFEEVKS